MPSETNDVAVAILGAGPAGIAAAVGAAHRGLSHVLIEKGHLANTIHAYQKKKLVMAEPRKLPLRARVPFQEGPREALLATWQEAVTGAGVNFLTADVQRITRQGDRFEITHSAGVTRAAHVVLAIGVQGTPRRLGVPGEELPHVIYSLADPDEYVGREILVVGGGDAGIENALALIGRNSVTMLNNAAEFSRAKDANVKKVTDAIESKQLRYFASSAVVRVTPSEVVLETPEGEVTLSCDTVIIRAGAIPPRPFLEACGIALPSNSPFATPLVDGRYESNVKGLFIVGALAGYPLIKQAMNQGYEVIEHICGHEVEPADAPLIQEKLGHLPGTVAENYQRIREGLPLLAELSEPQFREFLIDSTVHVKKAGEVLFERLDYTDTLWNVVSGSVEVRLEDRKKLPIEAGHFFGELGLISGRRRAATVAATVPSLLVETPRKQILKLISSVASVKRRIDETFVTRSLQSLFPEADASFLHEIAGGSRLKIFKKGETLFRQGDPGDALYMIRRGSVKISRRDATGADIPRTYLPAGHFVGEMALLSDDARPRSATVSAAVGCETIVLEKSAFRALLATHPVVAARVTQLAEQRRLENLTAEADPRAGAVLDFMFGEGFTDAGNMLVIDSDRCVACDNCETACAATHGGESLLDRSGGRFFAAVQVPIACRHCENPLCMTDCPPDVLVRKPDGEVIIRDGCIGCGKCMNNCPYDVIKMTHPKPKARFPILSWFLPSKPEVPGPAKAAKCDMCASLAGGPACVRSCPTGAAIRINPSELGELMRLKGGMR